MELKGKIISFIGDSITEGNGVTDIQNCRYDNRLNARFGFRQVNNYGVGGTRLARQTSKSEFEAFDRAFCMRIAEVSEESDIIVVFGGTNDYSTGDAPFGSMTDSTPHTFCGAVQYLMTYIKQNFPMALPVFITPARRAGDGNVCTYMPPNHLGIPTKVKGEDAKPLRGYVDVIMEKAKQNGIAVLDMYDTLPINPNFESDREKYTTDGLHFNDEGHMYLAKVIGDFLQTL